MLFQIVIAASVQMRQEVCGVGGANGDLEAKQLGAFGLSFFGICGLYVCILLYDVNTCIYILDKIRIFHRIHHPKNGAL